MNNNKDKTSIKICPILSASHIPANRDNIGMVHCLKEACAFYHTKDERGCALLIISTNISRMWNYGIQTK